MRKKAIDRIRSYINDHKNSGRLFPGDRLPSIRTIASDTGSCYLTVRNAVETLAREGVVDIKSRSGIFVSGARPLKVLLNTCLTDVSFSHLKKMLDKHLSDAHLHLELDIEPVEYMADPSFRREVLKNYSAVVSIRPSAVTFDELPRAQLHYFPDYQRVTQSFASNWLNSSEDALPFTIVTYQIGANQKRLGQAGMSLDAITPDFSWWNSYVKKARQAGFQPASTQWTTGASSTITGFLGLLMMLVPYDENVYTGNEPLFTSQQGQRFFEIIKDVYLSKDNDIDPNIFEQNGAGLTFKIGSWIITQNYNPERPDKAIDTLAIIPYRDCNGRLFQLYSSSNLIAYMHHDLSEEARNRVWSFVKLLVSRPFQLDYCNTSGLLSCRNDIKPSDYIWNAHGEWDYFIPQIGTSLYKLDTFSPLAAYSLTPLLENYLLYNESPLITAQRMDQKKKFYTANIPVYCLK